MGLHSPRGKFERLDDLLAAKVWPIAHREDLAVAAACRNISARGCRFALEDEKLLPGMDLESALHFSIQLQVNTPPVTGAGKIAWITRQRGQAGKVCLLLGVEFTSMSFPDRERIKAHIASKVQ